MNMSGKVQENGCLGFNSFWEAIEVALGLRNKYMISFEGICAAIGVLTGFINNFIFNPAQQLYILLLFLVVDYITGVIVGIKVRKEGFSTRKGQRIIFLVISYSFAMAGSYWLSRAGEGYFFMPYVVFYYLSSVVVLSSFKNLAMLGWLPNGLTNVLTKYVDAHKDKIADIIKQAQSERQTNDLEPKKETNE